MRKLVVVVCVTGCVALVAARTVKNSMCAPASTALSPGLSTDRTKGISSTS
jgi:hypothetical protein